MKKISFHILLLPVMLCISAFSVLNAYAEMGDVSHKFEQAGLLKYQSPTTTFTAEGVIIPPRKPPLVTAG